MQKLILMLSLQGKNREMLISILDKELISFGASVGL